MVRRIDIFADRELALFAQCSDAPPLLSGLLEFEAVDVLRDVDVVSRGNSNCRQGNL